MAGRQIVIDIIGDATKFTAATRQATGSAQKFGTLFGKGFGLGAGIGMFNLASTAISKSTDYLVEGIAAAREEEVGLAKLDAALRANVEGWNGNTDAIEKTIRSRMTLGFTDDALRDSLARLVPATHDVTEAFNIQRTAMDLARFKGIDLETATQALVKVESGQYRMLKELGIVLEEGATQTEALAAVQAVAAGQAAAYSETSAAAAEELDIKLGELGETVGQILLPAVDFATDRLIDFSDSMSKVTSKSSSLIDRILGIGDAFNDLIPSAWGANAAMDAVLEGTPGRGRGQSGRRPVRPTPRPTGGREPTGRFGRAAGGPVWAGEAYTVGERGPETLVMGGRSGTVVPNGGGGSTTNVFIDSFIGSDRDIDKFANKVANRLVTLANAE